MITKEQIAQAHENTRVRIVDITKKENERNEANIASCNLILRNVNLRKNLTEDVVGDIKDLRQKYVNYRIRLVSDGKYLASTEWSRIFQEELIKILKAA